MMPLSCVPDFRNWLSCKKVEKPVLTSVPPVHEVKQNDDPIVIKDEEVTPKADQNDEAVRKALKDEVVIN